jgi:hypothetical protein
MIARLGAVFRTLGDEHNAERVLIQAVLLASESTDALDNLCHLFGNGREAAEKATAALGKVMALAESTGRPKRAEWLAAIGKLEATQLGKPREGLARLRDAIHMAPGRVEIYQALAEAHGDAHDEATREITSALAEFGRAQPTAQQVGAMLKLLAQEYGHAQRPGAAAAADQLAAFLGLPHAEAEAGSRPFSQSNDVPTSLSLSREAVVASLIGDEVQAQLLAVAKALAEAVPKWIRQEPETFGASSHARLSSRASHPTRALADRLARAFGDPQFDLYVDARETDVARVLAGSPPALVLPPTFSELPEVEQAADLARLLAYVALDIPWVEQASPEQVDGILFGALRVGSELWGQGEISPAADRNAGLWRSRIAKGVGRKIKRTLEETAGQIRPQPDSSQWRQAMRIASLRAAYVLTGDLAATLAALLRFDDELGQHPKDQLASKVFDHPLTRELVLFAFSDSALALRQSAGTA